MAARKTSTKPTRIWKFAARVEDEPAALDIMRAARRYYNQLVEIERRRHERFSGVRRRLAPDLAALEEEWLMLDGQSEDLFHETKRARQAHWRETDGDKRRLLPEEYEARKAVIDAGKKRVAAAAKPLRAVVSGLLEPAREEFKRRVTERAGDAGPRIKSRVNAEVLAEMLRESEWSEAWRESAHSDDVAHRELLAARASCGLSTGTYLGVEEAFARAKKDSLPRAPRFRSVDGAGKLQVQLRDTTYADALAGTSALRIAPAPRRLDKKGDQSKVFVVEIDQSVPRGDRRKLRLVSKMHRQPPPDAELKWAAVVLRRVGRRTLYEFQLTLEHESFAEPKRPAGVAPAVHVELGWSVVDTGVRVARFPGGEIVVPESILSQHEYAARIKGAADGRFDHVLRLLRRWMRGGPHRLTAWHRMRNEHNRSMLRRVCIEYARGILPVAEMWLAWKADRLPREEDLCAPAPVLRRWLARRGYVSQEARAAWTLYTWARKDEHLTQLHADSLRRFADRRDAFFRREAIRIATERSEITVDGYVISAMRQLPDLTMPGERPREIPQHNAHAAAPGRFRELLKEVMGPRCTPCERPGGDEKAGRARKLQRRGRPEKDGGDEPVKDRAAE